jgi:hypothetical protein
MRTTRILGLSLALGIATLLSGEAAFAEEDERAATPEEEASILGALEAQGYSGVDDIEVDDGRFELDAISPSGQAVDLELDLVSFEILKETVEEEED